MSKQVNKQVSNITKSELKNALKTAPNAIHADHIRATAYHAPPDMGESCVILIVPATGFPEQFTIHRPIGVTDLKPNNWVMTRSSDVSGLLARAKNPNAGLISMQQARNRTDHCVDKGILNRVVDDVFYPFDEKKTRNEYLNEADEAFKKAKKAGTAADKATREAYLEPQALAIENAIRRLFETPDGIKARDKGIDFSFRTRGGVLENEEQTAIPGATGKTLRELQPHLGRITYMVIGKGQGVTVTNIVTGAPAAPPIIDKEEEEEDEDPAAGRIQIMEEQIGYASNHVFEAQHKIGDIIKLTESIDKKNVDESKRRIRECADALQALMEEIYNFTKAPGQIPQQGGPA